MRALLKKHMKVEATGKRRSFPVSLSGCQSFELEIGILFSTLE